MKRVGIITINDYSNYGNRLQNYALQEIIKSLGCECETIVNDSFRKQSSIMRIRRISELTLDEIARKVSQTLGKKAHNIMQAIHKPSKDDRLEIIDKRNMILRKEREEVFKKFTQERIRETKYKITPDNIPDDLDKSYDAFIVGSDQVWNPNYRLGSPIDFLTFAAKEKRISYAASFGISKLPKVFVKNYTRWLSEFEHISVREIEGSRIVKELVEKDVEVLVDPTLLLNKEQWIDVSKQSSHKPDKPYILTYFLGEISTDIREKIRLISIESNLEIINLVDLEDQERYIADPAEFLDYIKSSEVFLTDSFHGAVFSILFEKPFIVFDRISKAQSMNSRINTLLTKFELLDRKAEDIKWNNDIFNIDFSHVSEVLDYERNKAINYLKKALDIKDEK